MMRGIAIFVAALIGGAWLVDKMKPGTASAAANTAADLIDRATGGMLKLSAMRNVNAAMLAERNVQAMLRVIRAGEGTSDANGYRRIFGGQLFSSFADHPRVFVPFGKTTSSAAGAYQFLASSWDETKRIMGLADFSPASQDLAALGRIAARGALDDVRAGRFSLAVSKLGWEWASLPGSPYGQPTRTIAQARTVYVASGGTETA